MREKYIPLLAAMVTLAGAVLLCSTFVLLSPTVDEPAHLAAGMEWLYAGRYTAQFDLMHPPFARLLQALPMYLYYPRELIGEAFSKPDTFTTGTKLLLLENRLPFNTVLMRLGTLAFYPLMMWAVYRWSASLYGRRSALYALLLCAGLPTLYAHAGLATTDFPYTALLVVALWRFTEWVKAPTQPHAAQFTLAATLMAMCKFSALMQFPAAIAAYLVLRPAPLTRTHFLQAPVMVATGLLGIGLLYLGSFYPLYQGVEALLEYNHKGRAYPFLGTNGPPVWYYFPVVFFYKTPVAFLLLSAIAAILLMREKRRAQLYPLLAALAILLVSMTSRINLGVRHVLPLYPLLAMTGGYALHRIMTARRRMTVLALLLWVWQMADLYIAYPDYIAYYNLFARGHGERISIDSNLDWGQNNFIVMRALKERQASSAFLCVRKWSMAFFDYDAMPLYRCPKGPVPGWLVVSRDEMVVRPAQFEWLNAYRPQAVYPSFMLYYTATDR